MFGDQAIDELNRRFYSVCPADYFDVRRKMLASLDVAPDDDEGQAELARFRVIESTVLLHHASEALLRLYVAHVVAPDCPWLEVAAETSFSRFKDRVREEVLGPSAKSLAERDVPFVFLGNLEPTEEHRLLTYNTAVFLRSFASTWLDDARLYNAAKHGLAVIPGTPTFALGETGGDLRSLGYGTAIEFLEHHGWEGDVREWSLTTAWSSADETLTKVGIVCMMIRSLWAVARRRFDIDAGRINVILPSVLPKDLPRDPDRGPATTMSWRVLEERR